VTGELQVESTCEEVVPSVRCSACGLVQFQKAERTQCRRCKNPLQRPEPIEEEPEEPEVVFDPTEPYARRFENALCMVLYQLRKQSRLTQVQVARLGGFGVRSYISKIENPKSSNRTIPTIHSIERFALVFKVDAWQIIAAAEKEAGKYDPRRRWWKEMRKHLNGVRAEDRASVLTAARELSEKSVATIN